MRKPRFTYSAVLFLLSVFSGSVASAAGDVATHRQYLSGRDRDSAVPWEFYCTGGAKSGTWSTIPVPSCWDVKGFGTLSYSQDDPKQPTEEGQYRYHFEVPSEFANRRTFLVFDGVFTDTDARINGKSVGPVHQGGFYQFQYEVTDLLQTGRDNLLEVNVKKKSDNNSVNRAERQADFWIFGGIFRPVYLKSVPKQFIDRVAIDAKADGTFAADVITPANETADTVLVDLLDQTGAMIGSGRCRPGERLQTKVDRPETWTAETPNLYTARFRLVAGNTVLHEVTQRFGFRTIEVRPGVGVFVNGSKVVLKGICRHAAWPDSGRTLTPKIDHDDVELIKGMNLNAVRMSHYPPDESFLDECDELGLYVLDEMTGWQKAYDSPTAIRLAGETVRRDVNHPSILFWDNGNEGGWNTDADPEFDKWDPQHRAVLHPWAFHGEINAQHYPDYVSLQKLLQGPNIVMPTEFQHGLFDGGIGAGFRDYRDLMHASSKSAGGFIWALLDEGVIRPDTGKMDVALSRAPDGVVGPYRQKEGSYYTIRQIWSPVDFPAQLPADFDGGLPVNNDYNFTSLSAVKFHWSLLNYHRLDDESAGHTVTAEGDVAGPDVAPGAAGELRLHLPADWKSSDALAVSAVDWTGLDVIDRVFPLDATKSYAPSDRPRPAESDGKLVSGNVTLTVDPGTGVIQSIVNDGRSLTFKGGPRLALGTPPAAPKRNRKPGSTTAASEPADPIPQGKLSRVSWSAGKDGWFCLDYTIEASGPCSYLGITFDLPPEQVKSARWLGLGPYRVYKNRMEGGTVDVWNRAANNTMTGWSEWDYPEFRGYFGDLRWAKLTTTGGTISIVPETRGLFLHLLTPDVPPDGISKTAVAEYPDGSISILHAISAIGNKFNSATKLGPQSMPFQASGEYSGRVWLRFN